MISNNAKLNDNCEQDSEKRDAFAHKFMKEAKRICICQPMSYEKFDFAVIVNTPYMRQKLKLINAFCEYQAACGKARNRVLKRYGLGFRESITHHELKNAPFIEIRKRLRPLLRSRILTDNERYEFKGDDPSQFKPTPRRPFSGDANILLGLDNGRSIAVVDQNMLDTWSVSFDDALDIAKQNLATLSRPRFKKIKPGLFMGNWNDYYESSRLLMPTLFAECSEIADPVFMVPTSERIYFADKSSRRAQLDMLHCLRNDVSASKKIVSTQMYHITKGIPTQYEPEDNQILLRLDEIRKPLLGEYAHQQKKIVEDHLIRTGNWAYIMSLNIFQSKEDNSIGSISNWMAEQETIFPEADIITVPRKEETADGYIVRSDPVLLWEDVIKTYGHLLQKIEGFPNLYRAPPFSGNNAAMAGAA